MLLEDMMPRNHKISIEQTRNDEVGVESLKGYVNRSFKTQYIQLNDSYVGSHMLFASGVHYKPENWSGVGSSVLDTSKALVEVKYSIRDFSNKGFGNPSWKTIPDEVWRKFFSLFSPFADEKFSCRYFLKNMEENFSTLPDGKTPCFVCSLYSDTVKKLNRRIENCLVMNFLNEWQVKFPIFVKYWDKISTAKELNDIVVAFDQLSDVSYSVKFNKYGREKKETIDKLTGFEKLLAELEDKRSKFFEEAADAMNELSQEFGIELDIDDHCCSKPE